MMIRRIVVWLVGLTVLAGAIVAVVVTTAQSTPTSKGAVARKLVAGITATVSASSPTTRAVSESVQVSGVVGNATASTITPQTTGVVASLSIAPGSHVQAGQVVATLTDTQGLAAKQAQAQAALAQAQSALDQASVPAAQPAQVAQAQSQLDAAQTALQSAQAKLQTDQTVKVPVPAAQLRADQDSVTAAQRQLTSAQSYLSAVQHPAALPSDQVDAARSAVDADQAAVAAATAALGQLQVTAPVSGTVTSVSTQIGGYASPATPIAQLAGSNQQVTASVPPVAAAQLAGHVGAAASISLAVPNPPAAIRGTLGLVAPSANLQTQQTSITLDIAPGASGLTPGSPVTVTITIPLGWQNTVPSQAISYVNGTPGVYVLSNVLDPSLLGITLPATIPAGTLVATTHFTPVTVLATVGTTTAIRAALPTDAKIVTTGQTSVSNGQRVAVLPS